jgi:hypothetical protein
MFNIYSNIVTEATFSRVCDIENPVLNKVTRCNVIKRDLFITLCLSLFHHVTGLYPHCQRLFTLSKHLNLIMNKVILFLRSYDYFIVISINLLLNFNIVSYVFVVS